MKTKLLIISVLSLHFSLLLNTRFTVWPEMLLYPFFLNSGLTLYKDIINPYLPLLSFFLLFWFKITDFSLIYLKIITWATIISTDFLILLISKKIFKDTKKAILSLLVYLIYQIAYGGNQPWFDLFTTPFLIIYFYFLIKLLFQKKISLIFFSGIFFAISFFIKQTTIWFVLPFLVINFKQKKDFIKKTLIFLLPSILFFSFFSVVFVIQKNFHEFWFWSFKYPFSLLPQMPGHRLFPTARQSLLYFSPVLLLIILSVLQIKESPVPPKKIMMTALIFTLISILFCFPRWDIFHLQPTVAFASFLIPPISFFFKKRTSYLKFFSFFLVILFFLITTLIIYKNILLNWQKPERFFEPSIQKTAVWVKENTQKNDRIFVFNSEENIYFLSQRLPSTPWAINFSWYLEIPGLQERIIQGIKTQKPKYIIFQPFLPGGEYKIGSYRPTLLSEYILTNYKKVKEFEIAIILENNEN